MQSVCSDDDLVAEVQRCEGNLRKAAARLDMTREHLYVRLKKAGLWHVVNTARVNRVKGNTRNELIGRARRVLKG